jgi:drug/metabolite transporter, DME family
MIVSGFFYGESRPKNMAQNKVVPQIKGQWLVLAAAVLWGTTGTAQALAPVGVQPVVVGAVRLAIGGLALLLFAARYGRLTGYRRLAIRPTLLGAASIAAYQLCFFAAVSLTGVAVGTIVAIGSAPILAGLLSWLVDEERPQRRWIIATLLAVAGCTLLIASGGTMRLNAGGVFLALGAGAAYAVYAHSSKALLAENAPDLVTAVLFSLGAIFLLPILFISDLSWLSAGRGLLVALHLGLVATALAYILFTRGLQRIPVSSAVTLSLAEPLTAALLGVLILREQLPLEGFMGISLILAGLALLAIASGSKNV